MFGTVQVAAPRTRLCSCAGTVGASLSPPSELLPDRCTAELRHLHAELGAKHSSREATQLLETFLPCSPLNHASVCSRVHRVAERIEVAEATPPSPAAVPRCRGNTRVEIVVMIDGSHLHAATSHASRHLDVTVGKVQTGGMRPQRFALAPKGTERPAQAVRAALLLQGWQPGRQVTVLTDGERALPRLVSTATDKPVRHILDWWQLSVWVRHVEQALVGIYVLQPEHKT